MEKEICICAAIKCRGRVFFGHRHSYAIAAMNDALSWEFSRKASSEFKKIQGFITNKNRFVDRKEGCILQKEAGIESADKKHPYLNGELYSEDLY